MRKKALLLFVASLVFFVLIYPQFSISQDGKGMSKWEYYQKICQERGWDNHLTKTTGFKDRKYGLLDVGKVRLGIQNTNKLGYSRELITYEYPIGSGITYNWCQALIVAGKLNGEKRFSNGTIGCYKDINEQHYEPLPGYDSGIGDNGLAQSNKPNSWPQYTGNTWPADIGPIGSIGFPGVYSDGEVAANCEALWVAVDDDPDCAQPTPLHIKTYGRAMEWSSPLADDFIVFKFYIENTGTDTIKDCYVGVHTDMDAPEEGNGEWMDDFAKFISVEEDSVLGNMLYLWDGDDKSAGYIEHGVAWQGLKMLETPRGSDGKEIGLTTLVCETYDDFLALPDQAAAYDYMARGIDPPNNVTPHPTDYTHTENTYGPDVTSMHGSGPFDLAPGEKVTFTIANIFGINKADFMANATLCQLLYNANYKTAQPPEQPAVTAVTGDGKVTLYWNADPSENSIDPLTGNNSFEGYRIYRSSDQGLTWGQPIYNAVGALMGYVPIAQCDLVDGVTGVSVNNPFLNLGEDSGLFHEYTDDNLKNGVEYYYAVCAYDKDDQFGDLVIPPMENSRNNDPSVAGDNTVSVRPQAHVAGYQDASITELTHDAGIATGKVAAAVIDPSNVVTGEYTVSFVVDTTGTKVQVKRGGTTVLQPVAVTGPDDPNKGQLPVFEGVRLTAINEPAGIKEAEGTSADYANNYEFWSFGYYTLPPEINHDYEVEFTSEQYDIYPIWRFFGYNDPIAKVNFKITDLTSGEQIYPIFEDRGSYNAEYDNGENIILSHTPYGTDPADYSGYYVKLWAGGGDPSVGDKVTLKTYKPYTASDTYSFSTTKAKVEATEQDLKKIRVVPNPYAITSSYEYSQTPWVKEIQFQHLPEKCTISIFNVSGDLVRILHHEPASNGYRGPSIEAWNLWTYNDQEVAFGVYIYHVKAEGIGEQSGKFAIIK